MRLKSMKNIVIIDMQMVVIAIFGTSDILKSGCDPFTLSFDWLFCTQSHVLIFHLVYRHCKLNIGSCLLYDMYYICECYVRVMVDYVKQAQRSCKANKSLIELRDRGSLKSTKKIVIIDMHAVIMVIFGNSNIFKARVRPLYFKLWLIILHTIKCVNQVLAWSIDIVCIGTCLLWGM